MAKLVKDNIGAQSQDGINTQVGIQFLNPDRTAMLIPLEEDCPTDPDEMVIEGKSTYTLGGLFNKVKPSIEVPISTGDESNPLQDETISFKSIRDFEPEEIMNRVPLLANLKDKQSLIGRLEQLMREEAFRKIMDDPSKKQALVGFLKSVISEIETTESND